MIKANPCLTSLVKRVATRIYNDIHPLVEEDVQRYVENHVDIAFPLLDKLLNVSEDKNLDHFDQAALVLLSEIICFTNFHLEQKRRWATAFINEFQSSIAKQALAGCLNITILQYLFDILRHNETPINDTLRQANAALLDNYTDSSGITVQDINNLLEDIANHTHNSPYEMYEQLMSQTHQIVPVEVQLLMINEMAQANLPLIRETAILMLLHPDKNVRYYVAYILAKQPKLITATSLRRLIILRNWLPTGEQPAVDRLIKLARRHHIDCEAWPKARILKIMATSFDGVGAQSILAVTEKNGQYHLGGLLIKENSGVREPLLFNTHKKNEIDQIIRNLVAELPCIPVQEGYLDAVVSHFVAIGLQNNQVPSPLLLGFAEMLGASHWRAEKFNATLTLNQLILDLNGNSLETDIITKVLRKSKEWINNKDFAESWFEHDDEVDDIVHNMMHECSKEKQNFSEVVDAICTEILEPRRQKWQHRLLWMALWAKANTRKNGPNWQDFFILAHALFEGKPVKEIPLMKAISIETANMATKQSYHQCS